jgi:ABC-type Mn2+/Zn2+ transport system permease subunit
VDWLIEPLRYPFMRTALAAAALIALSCASVGVYVVMRRMAFLGDALAHTVLPGVVVAVLLGTSLLGGALVAGLVTALGIGLLSRREVVREDTAIGVAYSAMFALGVLLMSMTRSFRDFSHILFGNVLGVTPRDLAILAGIAALVLALLAAFHKELELTSVDPTHAAAIGLRPDLIRHGLLLLLAPTIVAGIQAVGVVMVTALLITPAATASLLTTRLVPMMALSVGVGLASGVVGLLVSFHAGGSSGATIVLTASAMFAVAWCAAAAAGRRRWGPSRPSHLGP